MHSQPRIALLLRRIGPYHHARFNHSGKELELHVIETRPGSEEYPWKRESQWEGINRDSRIAIRESQIKTSESGQTEMKDESRSSNSNSRFSNSPAHLENATNNFSSSKIEITSDLTYHTYALPIAPNPERGWRGNNLRTKLASILDEINPQVIITTGWADAEYHAAVLWAKKSKVPCSVISDSTETDVKRYWVLEWIKRQIIKNYSTALVAGTRSREYMEKLGMPSDRISTAWDVVDNQYFFESSLKLKNDPVLKEKYPLPDRYFLCVSRYIHKKNIPYLIRNFAAFIRDMKHDRPFLVLLGTGEFQEEINRIIDSEGINNYIYQFGFIQYDEIPYFYSSALALILPSRADQWGLVVNEAMASGLPVVVSEKCGCSDDLVENHKNGFLFNPGMAGELKEALNEFLSLDDEKIKSMKQYSLDKIKDYSLNNFSDGLHKAIYEAINYSLSDIKINSVITRVFLILSVYSV